MMIRVMSHETSFVQPGIRKEKESLQSLSANNKSLKNDIVSNDAFVASCKQEMQRLESLVSEHKPKYELKILERADFVTLSETQQNNDSYPESKLQHWIEETSQAFFQAFANRKACKVSICSSALIHIRAGRHRTIQ